jgi:hypothetical protein
MMRAGPGRAQADRAIGAPEPRAGCPGMRDAARIMFLGESPLRVVTADYESRLADWREWQPVAAAAQGDGD